MVGTAFETLIPVDTYDILFGIPNPNNDDIIHQLNLTILQASYYIYKCNMGKIVPEMFNFLLELKSV